MGVSASTVVRRTACGAGERKDSTACGAGERKDGTACVAGERRG